MVANQTDQSVAQTTRDLGINENTRHTRIGKYSRPVGNAKALRTDDHHYEELKCLKRKLLNITAARNL